MSPEIVPATPELMERFYGKPQAVTVRALAAVLDGEPLCIAGTFTQGGVTVVFANVRPEMRKRFKKTGLRLARRVMQMAQGRVVAMPDGNVEAAARFLEHLGFTKADNGVYAWTS